jgi:hypothetical protein
VTVANGCLLKSPSPNTKRATADGDCAARVSETPISHTPQTDKYVVIEISNSEELEERVATEMDRAMIYYSPIIYKCISSRHVLNFLGFDEEKRTEIRTNKFFRKRV